MVFGVPFDSQFDNRYSIPNKIYHRGSGIISLISFLVLGIFFLWNNIPSTETIGRIIIFIPNTEFCEVLFLVIIRDCAESAAATVNAIEFAPSSALSRALNKDLPPARPRPRPRPPGSLKKSNEGCRCRSGQ
jgi:hypothetical protein